MASNLDSDYHFIYSLTFQSVIYKFTDAVLTLNMETMWYPVLSWEWRWRRQKMFSASPFHKISWNSRCPLQWLDSTIALFPISHNWWSHLMPQKNRSQVFLYPYLSVFETLKNLVSLPLLVHLDFHSSSHCIYWHQWCWLGCCFGHTDWGQTLLSPAWVQLCHNKTRMSRFTWELEIWRREVQNCTIYPIDSSCDWS